jgi:hypothetical protein
MNFDAWLKAGRRSKGETLPYEPVSSARCVRFSTLQPTSRPANPTKWEEVVTDFVVTRPYSARANAVYMGDYSYVTGSV